MTDTTKIPKLRFKEFEGEWDKIKLKDIISIKNWWAFKSVYFSDVWKYTLLTPWNFIETWGFTLRWNNDRKYNWDFSKNYILWKWDIIIAMTEQAKWLLWSAAIIPESKKYLHNQRLWLLQFNKNKVSEYYIYTFFNNYNTRKYISETSVWTKVKHTSPEKIGNYKCFFPDYIEQKKIASFLSRIDKKIENIREKKKALEEYKKWVMQKIFKQEIRFKDESWKEFEEWKEMKLWNIATFSKWKWLSKSDIIENGINKCIHYWELFTKHWPKIEKIISYTNIEWSIVLSQWNEILMPTSDVTPNGLATWSAILEEGVILGWDILVIKSEMLNNIFFSYYIKWHKKDIMKLISWTTVYHLYGSDMKTLKITIPSILEQEKIANFLSDIDDKIKNINWKLEDTENFKKWLLQQMFI